MTAPIAQREFLQQNVRRPARPLIGASCRLFIEDLAFIFNFAALVLLALVFPGLSQPSRRKVRRFAAEMRARGFPLPRREDCYCGKQLAVGTAKPVCYLSRLAGSAENPRVRAMALAELRATRDRYGEAAWRRDCLFTAALATMPFDETPSGPQPWVRGGY